MTRRLALPALPVVALLAATPHAGEEASLPATLRLDYFHTGRSDQEVFSLDAVTLEGPWPGNPDRPIDDTNLGKYLFEVVDPETNRVVYSRGFASIYGEWETTGEAREHHRTFHESLRFPEPTAPVQVVLKKRAPDGLFHEAWSVRVDPAAPTVDRTGPALAARAWAVHESGPPARKVDVVLLGDGYTAALRDKWHRDARRLVDVLFSHSPFLERKHDFNVWAVDVASDESGVARPSDGVFRRSALRVSYDAFGSERYVLAFDNRRVREAAAAAPYEATILVVNDRKYGGGGIFNLYATTSADNAYTPYVLVHEFGHHFAALADEYYTSDVAYESASERPEPWEPNVTAHPASPKWRDLLTPGVVLPTPWAKEEYEERQRGIQERRRQIRARGLPEEAMEALFREEEDAVGPLLREGQWADAVGAFEGAMYEARGYYRPRANCMMFTRFAEFCPVCRRGLERVIDLYSRPAP